MQKVTNTRVEASPTALRATSDRKPMSARTPTMPCALWPVVGECVRGVTSHEIGIPWLGGSAQIPFVPSGML